MLSGLHNISEGFIAGSAVSLHTIERGFVAAGIVVGGGGGADVRVTEGGDTRVTEAGDRRILES